jgi:hypothetical protein
MKAKSSCRLSGVWLMDPLRHVQELLPSLLVDGLTQECGVLYWEYYNAITVTRCVQQVDHRNVQLRSIFVGLCREWKRCCVTLHTIRSTVSGCVMLFFKIYTIPLHESCTRTLTSWRHSFAPVWQWTFIPLTLIKHQQPVMKRFNLAIGRRGQQAYVTIYFLLTLRLLWDLMLRRIMKIWGHVSHFITRNWSYLRAQWSRLKVRRSSVCQSGSKREGGS